MAFGLQISSLSIFDPLLTSQQLFIIFYTIYIWINLIYRKGKWKI